MLKVISRLSISLILLCLFAACTSIKSYYPIQNHAKVSFSDLQENSNPQSVQLSFQFQRNGSELSRVSLKYSPTITRLLRQSNLFSEVNDSGIRSETLIEITMNNHFDSLAGAAGQGVLSGLTLGTVGTKVTDNYAITATYHSLSRNAVVNKYDYALTSTSGLIKGSVEDVEPKKSIEAAINTILEQFIVFWLKDLQEQGFLTN